MTMPGFTAEASVYKSTGCYLMGGNPSASQEPLVAPALLGGTFSGFGGVGSVPLTTADSFRCYDNRVGLALGGNPSGFTTARATNLIPGGRGIATGAIIGGFIGGVVGTIIGGGSPIGTGIGSAIGAVVGGVICFFFGCGPD